MSQKASLASMQFLPTLLNISCYAFLLFLFWYINSVNEILNAFHIPVQIALAVQNKTEICIVMEFYNTSSNWTTLGIVLSYHKWCPSTPDNTILNETENRNPYYWTWLSFWYVRICKRIRVGCSNIMVWLMQLFALATLAS